MKYARFSANDFINDEYFQRWVFSSDESVHSFWQSWLERHPEKNDEVQEAKRILKAIHFETHILSPGDVSELWSKIHEDHQPYELRELSNRNRSQWLTGIAAAVLITVIGLVYYWSGNDPWKEYHTAFGETSAIELPDGSSVVLNANSSLTIHNEWNAFAAREISIDGEAFFDVKHTLNNQPFKVHTTDGITVEVLGTSFDIYNRINSTKVILNTGQIRLNLPSEKSSEQIVMRPGEMIEYSEKKYNKKEVNPKLYTAWTSNKIILDHTTLEEMVRMLRDTYGLEVRADSALLRQTVSGSMPLGNAEVLLDQMSKAFQFNIVKNGNVITISESNK